MNSAPLAKAPSINGRKADLADLPEHALRRECIWLKVVFAFLSAGLLICSLPSADVGSLAWIALVPLLIACEGAGLARAAGVGFLTGFVAAFGIYTK